MLEFTDLLNPGVRTYCRFEASFYSTQSYPMRQHEMVHSIPASVKERKDAKAMD